MAQAGTFTSIHRDTMFSAAVDYTHTVFEDMGLSLPNDGGNSVAQAVLHTAMTAALKTNKESKEPSSS